MANSTKESNYEKKEKSEKSMPKSKGGRSYLNIFFAGGLEALLSSANQIIKLLFPILIVLLFLSYSFIKWGLNRHKMRNCRKKDCQFSASGIKEISLVLMGIFCILASGAILAYIYHLTIGMNR